MTALKRAFKGIWIPKEIWESKKLTQEEKLMYAEIDSLDNERGCFASNKYFADFFMLSERQVRTHITSLVKKGLIKRNREGSKTRILKVIK